MTTPAAPALDPGPLAARLLAAVEQHYTAVGVALPERRYLLAGQAAGAAWDDPHVSVSLNAIQPGLTAASRTTGANGWQVPSVVVPRGVYEVRILRCWPTLDDDGEPPAAEEITAAAVPLMLDAGLLLQAMFAFAASDPSNAAMTVGEVAPLGPLGGLAGYATVVTISPLG